MIVCGIDPGKTGGIAFYDDLRNVVMSSYKMPLTPDKRIDVCTIQDLLVAASPVLVCIEIQSLYRHQGGGMTIGVNYGRLTAVVDLCGFPLVEVEPKKWQAALGVTGGHAAHVEWCLANWHDVPFSTYKKDGTPTASAVRHDGIAAAICIAAAAAIGDMI